MQNQKLIPIGVGLLNVLGFGLGHFLIKRWIRGLVGFVVSVGLLAAFILTRQALFLIILVVWLLLLAADGWNQARGMTFETGLISTRSWFPLALALLLLIVYVSGGFAYVNAARSAFAVGMVAYEAADCAAATQHFRQVTGIYQLANGSNNRLAAEKITECNSLALAQRVLAEGEYVQAVSFTKSYLSAYPNSPITQQVIDQGAEIYVQWAAELQADSQYEEAVRRYLEIEPNFPGAAIMSSLPQEIAVVYLAWGDSLVADGDFESGIMKYRLALDRDPDLSSALQIDEKIAAANIEYAASLRSEEDFEAAIEKYLLVLDDYGETPAAETALEELANTYLQWGNFLAEQGDNAGAVQRFEFLIHEYPDSAAAGEALSTLVGTYLGLGQDLAEEGRFNASLEAYQALINLNPDAETRALAEDGIAGTIAALSMDTGSEGQALVRSAGRMACDQAPVESAAVNTIDENEPGKYFLCTGAPATFSLSASLEAQYPGELRFVVIINTTTIDLDSAPYGESGDFTLIRRRVDWAVTVINVDTGSVWSTRTFTGGAPPDFPPSHFFSGSTSYLNGAEPGIGEVLSWLEGIN